MQFSLFCQLPQNPRQTHAERYAWDFITRDCPHESPRWEMLGFVPQPNLRRLPKLQSPFSDSL
jgi:hypothetical protein